MMSVMAPPLRAWTVSSAASDDIWNSSAIILIGPSLFAGWGVIDKASIRAPDGAHEGQVGYRYRRASRRENKLRLPRLPEGAGRQRTHHHAVARGGLRACPWACRGRPCLRQHLRLPRQRAGGVAWRHRRGAGPERQGDRDRLHG